MKKLKEMDKHMKRWIVILITALAAMLAVDVCAQEPQRGVKISGGADIVSGYVWRGVWESGACIQPVMTLSAGNFSATAWGSVDFAATSYKEMDLTLAYALGPVTFSLADLYWEGGAGDRSTISRNYFRFGADSPHRVEAGVAWCISPEAPVTLAWNTVLFGAADVKILKSMQLGIFTSLNWNPAAEDVNFTGGISLRM